MSRICATQKSTPLSSCVNIPTYKRKSVMNELIVVVDCRKKQCVFLDMFDGKCTQPPEMPTIGNKCTGLQILANKQTCLNSILLVSAAGSFLVPSAFFSSLWMSAVDLLPSASEHILRTSPLSPPPGPWNDSFCGFWIIVWNTPYMYRGADKSLARPGRKQATATEDFDVNISYI